MYLTFFSTKKSKTNFGLGLSYCFNVMQQHGGSLEIGSKSNSGTNVSIVFPKTKAISFVDNLFKRSFTDG